MRIANPAFFILGLLWISQVSAQNLRLPISNYTNQIYGRTYEASNQCILTDHRNLVYAGNTNGIIEYDGSQWRFIPIRQGAYVTSLSADVGGKIFVGSQNEFGYLDPDASGSLTYRSLSDSLDEFDRFFTVVWATHAAEDRIYFQSEETLFIYQDDQLLTVYPENSFHTSFLLNQKLYIRERSRGLMVLNGEELQLVQGGDEFAELGIFAMFPLDEEGGLLIVTREKGLYTWHPDQGMQKMPTDQDDFLVAAGVTGGIPLSDGNFALNTLHEGVIVIDQQGQIQAILNNQTGLQSDDVKSIFQDNYENIWCALSNGISKIDYSSSMSFYDENAGLEGGIHAVVRYRDRLYVGTTSGLFVENKSKQVNRSIDFSAYTPVRDPVWDLLTLGNTLMIGTNNGLYQYENGRLRKISEENSFDMHFLKNENLLLVGGDGGLTAYHKEGQWKKVIDFPDITEDVKSIAVNQYSLYDDTEIWIGTSYQGVIKILLGDNLVYEAFKYQGEADGLTVDWVLPMNLGDSVVFGTRIGLLQFADEMLLREVLPDSLKDDPDFNRGYFEGRLLLGNPVITPISFVVDADQNTWAVIDNEITLIQDNAHDILVQKSFKKIDLGKINMIYPEDESVIWFGAADGLARFDMNSMKEMDTVFNTAVRRVLIAGDSVIYNGTGLLHVPEIQFRYNNIQFTFTSPFYDDELKNQFSWRLVGGIDEWTDWTNLRITSYTNLREGEYEFQVRAKNIYGDISPVAVYKLIVRPPWQRTPLAFVIYVILFIAFTYLAVRLGQMQLRRKNERLEGIVQQRTAEIRKQNIELTRQKQEITDSINYAEQIQRAILPQTDKIASKISGYFILFKPKDIVSGDFYWLAENGKKIIITAVDCTGHGVPGAFMSMLGISFLNKIILENNTVKADMILNDLRQNVITSLKQTGREGCSRDGMDMSLVVIDMDRMTMEFSGANNPLYMIRENELNETKADRMPISYHTKRDSFSNHIIPLQKGDCYYLFSDGYADQFGGTAGKKFKYKAFKELLMEHKDNPMEDQKQILDKIIEDWKAVPDQDGNPHEQVDDILIIGIRI